MVSIHFSVIDYGIIVAYLLLVLILGITASRSGVKTAVDYLVAGRSITLPAFIATIVATWYNGVLGVGEMIYWFGLGSWTINAMPYYIFGLIFAFFLAEKVRNAALCVIPDRFEQLYGKWNGAVGGILSFVLTNPAPNLLMVGTLLIFIFPQLNLLQAIIIGAALSSCYLYIGGLKADVRINAMQFVLMFVGFAVMAFIAVSKWGSVDFLKANLSSSQLSFSGGQSPGYLLTWFFIALWTLVEPSFHQRVSATKDAITARKGLIGAVACWFIFDMLTMTAGLYGWAAFNQAHGGALPENFQPAMIFPWMSEQILPPGIKGAFWVGMMSAIMAGAIGFMFVSGSALGRDFIWRLAPKKYASKEKRFAQIGLVLATIIGILIAWLLPSVKDLWYFVGVCVVPALLIPVIGGYYPKVQPSSVAVFMILTISFLVNLSDFVYGQFNKDEFGYAQFWYGVPPFYPGMLIAVIIWGIDKLIKRNNKQRN